MKSVPDRLLKYIDCDDPLECWVWKGSKDTRGYGHLTVCGKPQRAHRLMFEFKRSSIPAGMCVLHTCDNRACVNPNHLFLGTQRDNLMDMIRKGRRVKAYQKNRL
jgi:hypothetical protein